MIFKSEKEFAGHLKQQSFYKIYLLYGMQSYYINLYQKKISSKVYNGKYSEFNLHSFDGGQLDIQQFATSVEALPFMNDRSLILIDDINLAALSGSQIERICEILADPPESSTIIITAKTYEFKDTKANKIIKIAEKQGCVVKFESPTSSDIVNLVKKKVEKQGCIIDTKTANYLIQYTGTDIAHLGNEILKLCFFIQAGEILKEHIDLVTTPTILATVFDLTKSILRQDFDTAMYKIDCLFYLKEQPIVILAVLSSTFIDLYRAKLGSAAGLATTQISSQFDRYKNKEWLISSAVRDSSKYTVDTLRKIVVLLADADLTLKSSPIEKRIIIEQIVVKIFIELQK